MNGEDINTMYPITNRFWQYIDDMSLYEYLVSLGSDPRTEGFIKSYPKVIPSGFI